MSRKKIELTDREISYVKAAIDIYLTKSREECDDCRMLRAFQEDNCLFCDLKKEVDQFKILREKF